MRRYTSFTMQIHFSPYPEKVPVATTAPALTPTPAVLTPPTSPRNTIGIQKRHDQLPVTERPTEKKEQRDFFFFFCLAATTKSEFLLTKRPQRSFNFAAERESEPWRSKRGHGGGSQSPGEDQLTAQLVTGYRLSRISRRLERGQLWEPQRGRSGLRRQTRNRRRNAAARLVAEFRTSTGPPTVRCRYCGGGGGGQSSSLTL